MNTILDYFFEKEEVKERKAFTRLINLVVASAIIVILANIL